MAAQKGNARFVGMSGTVYNKAVYFDDTAGNPVRFDGGSGASTTSPTSVQFGEAVALTDVVLAAATGQTQTQLCRDDVPTGDILLNALHLAAVTTRPPLATPYAPGQRITMIQLA